jgi:hypothetical protein
MKALLFEQFWLMLAIGIAVSIVSFYLAVNRRTRFWLAAAKVVPVVFLVLLAVNLRVVTDREAIGRQVNRLIAACEAGNTETLRELLDEDFTATGLSKADILVSARDVFTRMRLDQIRVSGVENKPPMVEFVSYTHVISRNGTDYGWVRSDWHLEFRRDNGTWRLFDVRPISVLMQPVSDMREVLDRSRQVQ